MATHTSVLAWRIPWTEEPGGLWFIGSHRVGHDWSDLACTHCQCRGHRFNPWSGTIPHAAARQVSPWATATEAYMLYSQGPETWESPVLRATRESPHTARKSLCAATQTQCRKKTKKNSGGAEQKAHIPSHSLCMAVCFSLRLLSSTENVLTRAAAHFCLVESHRRATWMDNLHALLGSTDLAVDLQWGRTDPFIPLSKEGSVLFKPDSSRGRQEGGWED